MNTFLLRPITRKHIYIALAIALLALIARLAFISLVKVAVLDAGDQRSYWTYAEGVAAGLGFHSAFETYVAFWPPLYSYFLAGIFHLYGENIGAVYVVEAGLWAAAAYWFYLCIVRLVNESAALFGGLCFALLPHFFMFTKQILTEALYIPLLIAFIGVLVVVDNDHYQIFKWLFAGFLLGALALTRREAALPAGLIFLALVYFELRPNKVHIITALALTGIVTALMLAPWLIRNWGMLGTPEFSTAGGWNLLNGNNPDAKGEYTVPPPDWAAQIYKLDEVNQDKLAGDLASNWIKNNVGTFLALIPLKFAALWGPANNFVVDMSDLVLIPFYILGAIRLSRMTENRTLIWVIILSLCLPITILCVIFSGTWRFRLVVYPALLLLAACCVMRSKPKQLA